MTMENFIILSVIGMGILGMLNVYIAYLSCRLLSLTKAILQETVTIRNDTKSILKETIIIRKDTERIRDENILIRKISEQVRDKL
jgi:hypothetical protein